VEAPTRGKNVENYDIDMVWSIMQDEIRTLLRIHLEGSTSDGKMRPDGLPAELSLQDEQLEVGPPEPLPPDFLSSCLLSF
jgi:hypothetical protein